MDEKDYNPRYLIYCKAMGEPDPEKQLAIDDLKYPGGRMCGFISWSSQKLVEARKAHPEFFSNHELVDHDGYDAWLASSIQPSPISEPESGTLGDLSLSSERLDGINEICLSQRKERR